MDRLESDAFGYQRLNLASSVSFAEVPKKKFAISVRPIKLVLASSSPRRKELLENLGIPFEISPPDVDECIFPDEKVGFMVRRLSQKKVKSVQGGSNSLILSADTAVDLDGNIFGKPRSKREGLSFLRRLSGRAHKVHTGVSVLLGERIETFSVVTEVYFGVLTEEVIDWYWSVGESFDKAGAYGIQGAGGLLIDKIVGSHTNVMGLPIRETIHCLEGFGFPFFLKNPDKNY